MNYDERMKNEINGEKNVYWDIIDLLENGDISIDFMNKEIKSRLLTLNDFVVNLLRQNEKLNLK